MSDLIVVAFEQEEEAQRALDALRTIQTAGEAQIADAAVIRRDPDGKAHVKGRLDANAAGGAVIGGALGLMIMVFFPIIGIVAGAIGGAIVGHMVGDHIDKDFVREVTDKLEAGHSALFVLLKGADADSVLAALRPIEGGHVLQTTLDEDVEAELDKALA
jgi:uncharacterized membrane protein